MSSAPVDWVVDCLARRPNQSCRPHPFHQWLAIQEVEVPEGEVTEAAEVHAAACSAESGFRRWRHSHPVAVVKTTPTNLNRC